MTCMLAKQIHELFRKEIDESALFVVFSYLNMLLSFMFIYTTFVNVDIITTPLSRFTCM